MIDFSKYTLQELHAIVSALDTMLDDISEHDISEYDPTVSWVFHEYGMARLAVEEAVKKQASAAGEAPAAADPPASPDMFGWVGDALDDLCADVEVLGSNE